MSSPRRPRKNPFDNLVTIGYPSQEMTGDQLRRKREELNMSQAELAKRLGLTKITVLRYENDQRDIPKAVELALKQVEREK